MRSVTSEKRCVICGDELTGKQRKYCAYCARERHLEQMREYYRKNTHRWQAGSAGDPGGIYYRNRNPQEMLGTGSLGSHRLENSDEELAAIKKELRRIGLR